MSSAVPNACFLFDNGSVRSEATWSLRRVVADLEAKTGLPVQAVSLLHSSKVPAGELGGAPARLLEPALVEHFEQFPAGTAVLLPLFFGPSAALTEYVPARLASLRTRYPAARMMLAPPLVKTDEDDRRIAKILADHVATAARSRRWVRPKVLLVDHGSPQPEVAAVRNHVGAQLREELGDAAEIVAVASMERREGAAYDFNDPLLANILRTPPFDSGEVVVALQFLSPGRHAGPGGDIAAICADAETDRPGLRTQMTEPIAADSRLVELLAERLLQAREL